MLVLRGGQMTSLLKNALEAKINQLVAMGKFPSRSLAQSFLAYVIDRLDIDYDQSISSWLDDDEYWDSLEVNND